jgi:hypothetical protein
LVHWVRPIYADGPESARELKFRRAVSAILLAAEYYIVIQASWIALVPHRGGLATIGVFYSNPGDSAVLVEKRFGLGYSLNFARPTAWIILLLLLMAPLIPVLAYFTHR